MIGLSTMSVAGCLADEGRNINHVVEVGPDGRYVFEPGTETPLRVEPGTAVGFDWQSDTHNIVVEDQPDGASWTGHEPIEDQGFSFSYTFEVPGGYQYVCEPHRGLGMTGEVIVDPGG